MRELDPKRLGLATTLISVHIGYAAEFLNCMTSIYPGYAISPMGSLIGLVYGLLDGFVDLYLIAWLYNFLRRRL